jgi:DNA-binding XRE family transcriptional regulator
MPGLVVWGLLGRELAGKRSWRWWNSPVEAEPHLYSPVRRRRVELGLTQQEAATIARLSLSGYAKVERGDRRPRRDTLRQIAAAFGTDPAALFSGNP